MPDTDRERDLLDSAGAENSAPGLPRPDLNPLVNPLLGSNMGRWAQVYFTSPPAQREKAVETLVQQLQAESGDQKPTASQASKGSDKSGAAPAREPDFELKPVVEATPPSPAQDPVATEAAEHAGAVCPGCLHKNAAEQRFCGICGMSLTRETPATVQPVPELTTRPATEGENSEADWQWLREKTLANFDTAQETKRGSRFVAGLVVFFVIAGGGYFLWQHRGFFSRRAPAPAPAATVPSSSATGFELPIPEPSRTETPASSNSVQQHGREQIAAPANSTSSSSSSPASEVNSPADGHDEFNQGRMYLEGQGVPRNSWMASQFLWKAVAKQNANAVLLLSDLYVRGDGVPRSCEQARILLVAAAKKGSSAAAQKLHSVENACR